MAISDSFTGLPIGLLICQPLIEVARGQAELCNVYLDQLFRLAFKTMPDLTKAEAVEARTVKFKLNRMVIDAASGQTKPVQVEVEGPAAGSCSSPSLHDGGGDGELHDGGQGLRRRQAQRDERGLHGVESERLGLLLHHLRQSHDQLRKHALERQNGEVRHLRSCRPTARRLRHGEAQQYLCLGYRADNELGQFYNQMKKDAPLGASFSFRP